MGVLASKIRPRKRQIILTNHTDALIFKRYHFDTRRQVVTLHGTPVQLSGTQFRLAALFFSNVGRVLSRDHIFAMVWGREFREVTRTIDSHVSRLRLLLQIEEHNDYRLQPVYKSGYRLLCVREENAAAEATAAAAA